MRAAGTIGWGILGTGGIAGVFTDDVQGAGIRVAAVGSRSDARAAAFAERHGVPRAHGSEQALIEDDDVDVVYVASPHPMHAAQAIAAMEAGKHVLVEKPLTLTGAEADAVARVAQRTGRIALEAMWTRFLPHMLEIRAAIAGGEIGEAQVLVADHTQALPTDPAHRLNDPALGGGALLDLGPYPLAFGVDLFGVPERALVSGTLSPTGVDQRVSGTLVHPGGKHTLFTVSMVLPGPNIARIIGTEGTIEIDRVWFTPAPWRITNAKGELVRAARPSVAGRGLAMQAYEVERMIASGDTVSPLMPLAESVSIMHLMDSIRRDVGVVNPQETTAS